ncbi:ribonuclease III [Candidatus Dojkabacteria bacterium]|nr:ribonuclease III [Candidatus Dojkabacteria bacterium]
MIKLFEKAEKKIGVEFKNKKFLETALTHRSYLNENQQIDKHNERLEYLGDAVLEFLVSKYLFKNYPKKPEGELTSFRSATVKTTTLADTSRELDFGKYLRMSKGEENTGGRDKDYLLANTFEAVLGAIYLDQGIKAAESYLKRVLFHKISDIVENRLDIDPKTKFQELAQELHKVTPSYELISEVGPDHEKEFTMAVYLGSRKYGTGIGASKQKAEESAAEAALEKIQKELKKKKSALSA